MLARAVLTVICLCACVQHGRAQDTCDADFDMVFLVDSSGSIRNANRNGVDNYGLMVEFMKRMVDLVQVSAAPLSGVKIGIVLFGNKGHIELDLSGDRNEIIGELNNLRYLDEKTNTSGGLWVARQLLQGDLNRQFVDDVILTITDGNPSEDVQLTTPYAQQLQNSGVTMFAIGVTEGVDRSNISALSSPDPNGEVREGASYWLLPDFGALASTVESIANVICATIQREAYCASNPCLNGATCLEDVFNFLCRCPVGYYGTRCENNYCVPQPCQNAATCTALVDQYNCTCPLGFYGTNCENDYCVPNLCENGATCIRQVDGYQCACPLGFYGVHCQFDYCSPDPCQNGGVCRREVDGYTCACLTGYYGNNCQYDYCDPDLCRNGATCVRHVDHSSCTCPLGFYGDFCENDYCSPDLCRNGATCVRHVSHSSCTCVLGFYGDYCQNDYCAPDPCQNGGTCIRGTSGYTCNCLFGFGGNNCEIDFCSPNPCNNGGTCVRLATEYRCECTPEYSGNRCLFPFVSTTAPPNVEFIPQEAASSNNNDDDNGYLIALIVVIILLVVGLLVLLLLCCCWSRFYAFCCKPRDKAYVAPITPFYTQKEVESATKATQAEVHTETPEALPPAKSYKQDLVVVPTCGTCGNVTQNCTCCKLCNRADCCGVHDNSSHQHHHNAHAHHHCAPACQVCDPAPFHQCSTNIRGCVNCNAAPCGHLHHEGTPPCTHVHHEGAHPCMHVHHEGAHPCTHVHHEGAQSHSDPQCNELLGHSSGFESMQSAPGTLPALGTHPANLTLQNSAPRRPTRKARRIRARDRRERSESIDMRPTSGMTSDTGSCSSRVLLIETRERKSRRTNKHVRASSRGAKNGGYSSDSEQSARRSESKDYVYIPSDCPKKSQRRTSEFLNESFHSTRATSGK